MLRTWVVAILLAELVDPVFGQSGSSIQGVWRVVETVGGRGVPAPTTVNSTPQPGYYIFTGRHYSITRIVGDKPRTGFKDPAKPTAEEVVDDDRFGGQFGTYEIKGDTLVTRPAVAHNPAIMAAGNPAMATLKVDGKTLTLTTRNAQGAVSTIRLTRVE